MIGDTISLVQGAFVKRRQILDAVLVANEVVEEVWKKDIGFVFKIDFEKAYDMVDWIFLDRMLEQKGFRSVWRGFRSVWRGWIRGCVSSANFSVIINYRPRGEFRGDEGFMTR